MIFGAPLLQGQHSRLEENVEGVQVALEFIYFSQSVLARCAITLTYLQLARLLCRFGDFAAAGGI